MERRSLPFFQIQMACVLILMGIFAGIHYQTCWKIFSYSPWINGIIIGCFLFGLFNPFWNLSTLKKDEKFVCLLFKNEQPTDRLESSGFFSAASSSFLNKFFTQSSKKNFSLEEIQALQAIIEDRLRTRHVLSRHMIKILVLLGLLGTFLGLIQTVSSISQAMSEIRMGTEFAAHSFQDLMEGIRAPLSGMGIAFSSSILGLTFSLILGFFDLLQEKAEKRFLFLLEENLFSKKLSPVASASSSGSLGGTAYTMTLLEQTAEILNTTNEKIEQSEVQRMKILNLLRNCLEIQQNTDENLKTFAQKIGQWVQQQEKASNISLLKDIAETTQQYLQKIDQSFIKKHLNDQKEQKSLDSLIEGQTLMTQELKKEIRLVTKTLSLLAEPPAEQQDEDEELPPPEKLPIKNTATA